MTNIFSDNPTWSIGIIVILFGIIAANRLTLWRSRRDSRIIYGKLLRDAFSDEIKIYESGDNISTGHILHGILIKAFAKHKTAFHEYRIHLGIIRRFRIDRAWKKYHGGDENNPNFQPYYIYDNRQSIFLSRVKKLLAFTYKN